MANRFWVGGTGTWDSSTTANWSASSGGASGASVPGSADTALFDTASGAVTVTTNYAPSITALTLDTGFTGSVVLGASTGLTLSGNLTLTQGTFDSGGQPCSIFNISSSNSNVRVLTITNSTVTITGTGTIIQFSTGTNLTLNAGGSIMNITDTGAAKTLNSGNASARVWGDVILSAGGTGGLTFNASTNNTFNNLTIQPGQTLTLASARTYTVNGTLTISGTVGNTVKVTSAGTSTISSANNVTSTYTSINGITATGGGRFQSFKSISLGGNTGWNISGGPSVINNVQFVTVGDGMSVSEKVR